MGSKHIERYSMSLWKCKSNEYHFKGAKMAITENKTKQNKTAPPSHIHRLTQKIAGVGEAMEDLETSYIGPGNVRGFRCCGEVWLFSEC